MHESKTVFRANNPATAVKAVDRLYGRIFGAASPLVAFSVFFFGFLLFGFAGIPPFGTCLAFLAKKKGAWLLKVGVLVTGDDVGNTTGLFGVKDGDSNVGVNGGNDGVATGEVVGITGGNVRRVGDEVKVTGFDVGVAGANVG